MTYTYTVEIGPHLYQLGLYGLLGAVLGYLIVQWWIIASTRGRR